MILENSWDVILNIYLHLVLAIYLNNASFLFTCITSLKEMGASASKTLKSAVKLNTVLLM